VNFYIVIICDNVCVCVKWLLRGMADAEALMIIVKKSVRE